MVQFEAISNPNVNSFDESVNLFDSIGVAASTSLHFTFDQLHSGSNLFGTVGDTANALIVIGEHPLLKADGTLDSAGDAIKTSQGGTGATIGVDSQMFDPGEGAYFTYVKTPNPDFLGADLSQTEANDSHDILYSGGTNAAVGASTTISQIQGNALASMKITAFDIADSPQAGDFVSGLGSGTKVTVTSVTVRDGSGNDVTGNKVTLNADGSATVNGLDSHFTVAWTTSAPHDRVLIEGVAGKFDIGAFDITQASAAAVDVGQQLTFEDDGPSITATATGASTLTVDETVLATDDTKAFAAQFNVNFGTDGAGATGTTYALSTPGGASGLTDTATNQSVVLSLVNGQVVGKTAISGDTVFVVSVDANGNVTLDQQRAIVHTNPNDPDESRGLTGTNLVVLTGTVTDKDGDHAAAPLDLTPLLVFKDDGPAITAIATGAPTLTVDETVLTTDATAAFGGQFSPVFGADGAGATGTTYALSTPGGASGLTDTATNQSVVLSLVNGQVVGKTAVSGDTVFVVSVDANGNVTLDQQRAIVHANPNDPDESRGLTGTNLVVLTGTVTDKDGDHAAAPLDLTPLLVFKDDGPAIGPIANSIVDFAAGSTATQNLHGAVGADPNTSPYVLDSFTASITVNGTDLHGIASNNNTTVTYWADTNHDTIFGDTGDTAFYSLNLSQTDNAGAGSYTFNVLVNPPPAELTFSFNNLPSGQNLFGTVGDPTDALVVIGKDPILNADGTFTNASDTINTSQGGGNVTIGVNNQMFDPGEGAYFTYVKSPVTNFLAGAPGGLDQNEADDADNIQYTGGTLEVTGASTKISQTQGNAAASMKITAFNIDDSPQARDFVGGLGSGTFATITSVTVNGVAVSFTPDGNGVVVGGLHANDTIAWTTNAVHDRVLIEDVAGKFDIGGFTINQPQPTPDQKLDFVARATDGDTDFKTASFSIGIDGTGINHDGHVVGVG
jgi:hypothetical protein